MFLKLESQFEILFQRWHDAKKAVRGFTYIFNDVTELLCILSQTKDVALKWVTENGTRSYNDGKIVILVRLALKKDNSDTCFFYKHGVFQSEARICLSFSQIQPLNILI